MSLVLNHNLTYFIYIFAYNIMHMRTTIDLPENLLDEAMKATNSKTKIEAIKKALLEVIEIDKRKKILNFRGKIDLEIDLDILRDRKELL